MKEAIWALEDELKRLQAEGCEGLSIDDSALEALAKFARRSDGQELPDTPELVKFAQKIDFNPKKLEERRQVMPRKAKVVADGFQIAEIPSPKAFKLPDGDKAARWNALRDIVLGDEVCAQHLRPGKKIVFGIGNLDADIFFCGEAPGADEEIQGEPFVGKAGQLLTKIIAAMGLKREDVYIGNIMNWRPEVPKGNRKPEPEEMNYCLPYLKAQVEIVKPEVIVALGATAVTGLLGAVPSGAMSRARGNWYKYNDTDLMITYHPSFLLQYASKQIKRYVWEDMMAVMERVGIPISQKQRGYFMPKEEV